MARTLTADIDLNIKPFIEAFNKAENIANDYVNKVSSSGSKLATKLDESLRNIQPNVNVSGFKSDLKQLEAPAKSAGKQAGEDFSQNFSSGFSNIIDVFAGTVLADLATSAVGGIIDNLGETNEAMRALEARTGATGKELENLKSISEDVFVQGVGGSIAEATNNIAFLQQQLGNVLAEDELEGFAVQAESIAKTFDVEFTEVVAKSRTTMQQLGIKGEEALNLITLALRDAGNSQEDVLDTFDEYAVQISEAGISAEQFTQQLITGVQGGARDTDKLADAIKEAGLRIQEQDYSTRFNELTESAQGAELAVAESIQGILDQAANGDIDVGDALTLSTQAIQDALNAGEISDIYANTLTTAIAGTPVEDVGEDLFRRLFDQDIDDDAIRSQAEQAGRAVQQAFQPFSFERFQRELKVIFTDLGQQLLPIIEPLFDTISESILPLVDSIAEVITQLAEGLISALEPVFNTVSKLVEALTPVFTILTNIVNQVVQPLLQLLNPIADILSNVLSSVLQPLQVILQSVINLISSTVFPILESVLPLIDTLLTALSPILDIVGALASVVVNLINIALQPLVAIITTVANVLNIVLQPFAQIGEVISELINQLFNSLNPLFNELSGIVGEVASIFGETLTVAIGLVIDILGGIFTAIGDVISALFGFENSANFFEGLLDGIRIALSFVTELLANVREGIASVKNTISSAGDAVLGFLGLSKNVENDTSKIKENIQESTDSVKGNVVAQKELGQEVESSSKSFEKYSQSVTSSTDKLDKNADAVAKFINSLATQTDKAFENLGQQQADDLVNSLEQRRSAIEAAADISELNKLQTVFQLDQDILDEQERLELAAIEKRYDAILEKERKRKHEALELAGDDIEARKHIELEFSNFKSAIDLNREKELSDTQIEFQNKRQIDAIKFNNEYEKIIAAGQEQRAKKREEYRQAELQREQEYLDKFNEITNVGLAFQDALSSAFANQNINDEPLFADRQNEIREQEEQLEKSLRNQTITYDEYVNQIRQLENEKLKIQENSANESINIIDGLNQGFASAFEEFGAIADQQLTDTFSKISDELLEFSKDAGGAITGVELNFKSFAENSTELFASIATGLAASAGQAIAEGENVGKALLKTLIDTVQSAVNVYSAQILAGYLAQPDSIFTGGGAGFAKWAAATTAINALLAIAKSSLGAEEGVIGISNNYNKQKGKTDTIPLWVAPGESVIDKKTTEREKGLLSYILQGGSSKDFFINEYGSLIKKAKELPSLDYSQVDNTNKIANKLDILTDEVRKLQKNQKIEQYQTINLKPQKAKIKGKDLELLSKNQTKKQMMQV